jgi:ribosome recycling factor
VISKQMKNMTDEQRSEFLKLAESYYEKFKINQINQMLTFSNFDLNADIKQLANQHVKKFEAQKEFDNAYYKLTKFEEMLKTQTK